MNTDSPYDKLTQKLRLLRISFDESNRRAIEKAVNLKTSSERLTDNVDIKTLDSSIRRMSRFAELKGNL